MQALFESVWGMSKTASVVILVVWVARAVLAHVPKKYSYVLWAVVLFRLLCPLSIESPFSPLPAVQTAPGAAQTADTAQAWPDASPSVQANGPASTLPEAAGDDLSKPAAVTFVPVPVTLPTSAREWYVFLTQNWLAIAAPVWLAGVAGLLGYSALSLLRLRHRLAGSIPLAGEDRVFLADHIPTPFVLGVLRPRIYLPSGLPECRRDYILLHERTHIRRLDYVTRTLAWLAVSIHWFNPLVWLSFRLAGQDMEMSCDEAVLEQMGEKIRSDYSESLLRLSVKGLPAGPLTFGGGNLKNRVSNVLDYKKPAAWVGAAALVLAACVGTAMATNQSHSYIDPARIVRVSQASTRALDHQYSLNQDNSSVIDELLASEDYELTLEKGDELVRLINSYRKSIYWQGAPKLIGEHQVVKLTCDDGSCYLVDFWYWNGFSFHPIHGGEDPYTTLVTYFDAGGNAGTTWQMEYDFDKAFRDWSSPRPPIQRGELKQSKVTVDGVNGNLTFSLYTLENDVEIMGTIDGVKLQPGASYWSSEPFPWYYGGSGFPYPEMAFEYPCGYLSLVQWELLEAQGQITGRYDGSTTRQFGICAGWTDESRTSVSISTKPGVINNSAEFHGYWRFTVDLSAGTVTFMEAQVPYYDPNYSTSDPVVMHPESISDEEAVEMARISARLIEAAELYFQANHQTAD